MLGATIHWWSMPLTACASTGSYAALVVDPGEEGDPYRLCVRLPDDSVSGIELIELAGEQHGLSYELGNGGQSVCMLAGVGSSSGDECFGEYPDFWGYWRMSGGSWQWSGTGAGSTVVEPGDVEGWSWGRGQDGSTHPAPPPTRFEDVCEVAAAEESDEGSSQPRTRDARPNAAGPPSGKESPPAGGTEAAAREQQRPDHARAEGPSGRGVNGRTPHRSDRSVGSGRVTTTAARDTASSETTLPQVASERSAEGTPVGAIVATGLAVVLIAAGTRAARRRKA